jgi:hypothetical protein
MEGVGLFYGHLVNFPTSRNILWPFGILPTYVVICYIFHSFGMLYQ